jgi:S-adenosylmethionine-diacylglycerol 3-amino-3-carboxypropyl transferase
MAFDTALNAPRGGNLVTHAVKQNRPLSIDGILERLFAVAFRGLVYPQIWEDPEVDMTAMVIEPHHHVVAIASGGCNVMSYLTASPARITAVDLNRAHVALTRLKLTGARKLPDWDTFYRFFGDADDPRNISNYRHYLRDEIDAETRSYWDGRDWLGRRRHLGFKSNIYHKGLLGRFIGLGHLAARFYGRDLRAMLECKTLDAQRQSFRQEIVPLFEKRLVKWLTGKKVSLYGLGIPPAQYVALSGGRPMAQVLLERLERLTCGFPLSDNYFAWQAFGRGYAQDASGPLPPYLQKSNFALVRANADRVQVMQASLTDALNAMPERSVDRFVLLDAQDWMNDAQLNALWSAIARVATKKARVIFRTAGIETILPGRVDQTVLGQWRYHEALSRSLGAADRSSIYGGFHIYERAN